MIIQLTVRAVVLAAFLLVPLAPGQAASVRVIDGDTVKINGETIRIHNIDTPEIRHAQCDTERRLGLRAKQRVEALLSRGEITILRGDNGRMIDKYGRTLALIRINGKDLGDTLVSEGLARSWTGRRQSWCETSCEMNRSPLGTTLWKASR